MRFYEYNSPRSQWEKKVTTYNQKQKSCSLYICEISQNKVKFHKEPLHLEHASENNHRNE